MTFGITSTGPNLPNTQDLRSQAVAKAQELFGDQINTVSNSPLGNIIDIDVLIANEIYEKILDVYNSQYPDTATGTSLDNACAYTGITRLGAAKSTVTARIFGDLTTVVPVDFGASVVDDPTSAFVTVESGTITTGIDEVQTITFSGAPTSGVFRLNHEGNQTVDIAFDDINTDVETALNNLASLSAVTVTGDYTTGFVVTFAGADGDQDQPLLTVTNNSLDDGAPVTVSIAETTKGYAPFVDLRMNSVNTGAILANAGTLTVIDTPTAGVTSVTNLSNAVLGRAVESDVALRQRRQLNLQTTQNGTDAGIRNKILNVDNVLQAKVSSNRTGGTVNGVPAHNISAVVLGGLDDDIGVAIESARPCGIDTFGSTTVTVSDSEGEDVDISFSRPTQQDIYFVIDIVQNTDASEGALFPADGADQIKNKIIEFTQNFLIGQDVIQNQFYTPINEVAGIIGIEVYLGTTPAPGGQTNISIANDEIAAFSSARITVNVT